MSVPSIGNAQQVPVSPTGSLSSPKSVVLQTWERPRADAGTRGTIRRRVAHRTRNGTRPAGRLRPGRTVERHAGIRQARREQVPAPAGQGGLLLGHAVSVWMEQNFQIVVPATLMTRAVARSVVKMNRDGAPNVCVAQAAVEGSYGLMLSTVAITSKVTAPARDGLPVNGVHTGAALHRRSDRHTVPAGCRPRRRHPAGFLRRSRVVRSYLARTA